jgi:hypothetical protein
MPRQASVTITRPGRDQGGVFEITEKPAYQATEWFLRAAQLMARAGVDLPPNILLHGIEGFATMGIGALVTGLGKAPWGEVKPLLDELLACIVSYRPPGGQVALTGLPIILQQISEPATILQLHEEVVSLHLGFSIIARLSEYLTMGRAWIATMMADSGPNTSTSIQASESSSPPS